ncbi:hypothetical protein MMC25_004348 [Agyrium rufum]|nr:hypothetical protein [Agyrium rufum]
MHDPFPVPCPAILRSLSIPLAETVNLPTLPLHIHEVIFSFTLYTVTHIYIAPLISTRLFPKIYPSLNGRTRLNWNTRCVSLLQSTLINVLALWVCFVDEERQAMDWRERVWGYTGAGGMIQGFAAGYFLYDTILCALYVDVYGWGMLAHGVSAATVYCLGFRPFVNYYGATFILYELSSPFLNFHWFFDKLDMTGTLPQLINGIILASTFFCCRLLWGSYSSFRVLQDVWAAIHNPGSVDLEREVMEGALGLAPSATDVAGLMARYHAGTGMSVQEEIMAFAGERRVPLWLAVSYAVSNITLNSLNWVWFGKMIEALRKRFTPEEQEKAQRKQDAMRAQKKKMRMPLQVGVDGIGGVEMEFGDDGEVLDEKIGNGDVDVDADVEADGPISSEDRFKTEIDGEGKRHVEVEKTEVRRRTKRA